jgi:hypothetical protein
VSSGHKFRIQNALCVSELCCVWEGHALNEARRARASCKACSTFHSVRTHQLPEGRVHQLPGVFLDHQLRSEGVSGDSTAGPSAKPQLVASLWPWILDRKLVGQ